MLRMQKDPVHFRLHDTVLGIPRTAYPNGYYSTRNRKEIAMLRRLAQTPRVDEVEELPGQVETTPKLGVEEMGWHELRLLGRKLEVYKVGMTRSQLIPAIIAAHLERG